MCTEVRNTSNLHLYLSFDFLFSSRTSRQSRARDQRLFRSFLDMQTLYMHTGTVRSLQIHINSPVNVATTKQTNAAAVTLTCNSKGCFYAPTQLHRVHIFVLLSQGHRMTCQMSVSQRTTYISREPQSLAVRARSVLQLTAVRVAFPFSLKEDLHVHNFPGAYGSYRDARQLGVVQNCSLPMKKPITVQTND